MKKAAEKFVDLVRDIVQQELDKEDNLVLCEVVQKKDDCHYDVEVFLGKNGRTPIHNVTNVTPVDLQKGDHVYLYKIRNQLQNSFIIDKIIPYIEKATNNVIGTPVINKEHIIAAIMGYIITNPYDPSLEYIVTGGSSDDADYILGYEEM